MDFSAFRPLNIFTWRPSVADTHSTHRAGGEQTQNSSTQTVISDESGTPGMVLIAAAMFSDPLVPYSSLRRGADPRNAPKRYVIPPNCTTNANIAL
jgi:hypothetical protein